MYTIDELINKSRSIHGDKYQYDVSTYTKVSSKMRMICPIHGEFFKSFHDHIGKKQGCPICAKENANRGRVVSKQKMTIDEIISESIIKFNNKFTYDVNSFKGVNSKIKIICPEHGEFEQIANVHLNSKYGCPKCALDARSNNKTMTTETFIRKAKDIHGDKYDYSNVEFIDSKHKVKIICNEHGEFDQLPYNHLSGNGCPKCGHESSNNKNTLTNEEFINRSNEIHNSKYEYQDKYVSYRTKMNIICPIHGTFEQTLEKHLIGEGCPKCANQQSKSEKEIYDYCVNYLSKENVIERDNNQIQPYELDIYIPSINFAIEYNGLRWHSDKFGKDKNYHLNKLNLCKDKGIKLIQVFEDEYVSNKDIVLNKIKHIIGFNDELPKIMGRKCVIKEIDYSLAKSFLDTYHIQGHSSSTIYLGAYYNYILIGVMTFKKEQINGNWELTRFASNYNYICQGVGGKLFKYFVRNYNPTEIKSFADRRWTVDEKNNIYLQLGFKFDKYISPDYHYYKKEDGIIRQHKFNFRKQILNKKYGLPLSMTESEMTEKLGYSKIYDCGLIKYIWRNS